MASRKQPKVPPPLLAGGSLIQLEKGLELLRELAAELHEGRSKGYPKRLIFGVRQHFRLKLLPKAAKKLTKRLQSVLFSIIFRQAVTADDCKTSTVWFVRSDQVPFSLKKDLRDTLGGCTRVF